MDDYLQREKDTMCVQEISPRLFERRLEIG